MSSATAGCEVRSSDSVHPVHSWKCSQITEGFTPEKTGDTVAATVATDGHGDYFYRAETEQELPLSLRVAYFLDGVRVEPDDLAGKSGRLRIDIGSAYKLEEELHRDVKGRDLVTGIPKIINVNSDEIRQAIQEQIDSIVAAVKTALEQTPPELAADIVDRGIYLTGGGALLKNLDTLLHQETGLPIKIADDPLSTVVMGSGKALDNLNILKEVMVD